MKLEECLYYYDKKYDAIIIDEAQNFKELWFELIFSLSTSEVSKHIFMDEMQDIFGHFINVPNDEKFIKYNLPENCRNTKTIVRYLSEITKVEIRTFPHSPEGEEIVVKTFANQIEQQKFILDEIKLLTREQGIDTDQILIILNTPKAGSCLGEATKAGKLGIKALDNKGRFQINAINYTTINTFKGLEADIVFDVDKIPKSKKHERLYTEASRAKHKLYVLDCG